MAKNKYFALPICSTCWNDPDMGEEFKEAKPNTPKCEDWGLPPVLPVRRST